MTTQTPQSPLTSGAGSDSSLTGSGGGASVRERASQVGGTAKDEAAGVAQEVKYQARDLVGEARGQLREQVDTQRNRLSEMLGNISDELDQMAERSDSNSIATDLVRQAASRARSARGYLDGGGDVVEDVRRFARRRPGTFLLGALTAGVLAGRATRAATAARKQQTSDQSGQYEYSAYATPSTAPASGYVTAPATNVPTSTAYGTTGYGTTTYESTGYEGTPTPTTDYGTTSSGATGAGTSGYYTAAPGAQYETGAAGSTGYATPAETLPPDEER